MIKQEAERIADAICEEIYAPGLQMLIPDNLRRLILNNLLPPPKLEWEFMTTTKTIEWHAKGYEISIDQRGKFYARHRTEAINFFLTLADAQEACQAHAEAAK